MSAKMIVGNALRLPFRDGAFGAVVTSPVYGNRMSDHHDARDGSRRMTYRHSGSHPAKWSPEILGAIATIVGEYGIRGPILDPFAGVGAGELARATRLDVVGIEIEEAWARGGERVVNEALRAQNAGQLQWGEKYRDFHLRAWGEVWRVLGDGGWFVLNVSDHYRRRERQHVTEWHLNVLKAIGFRVVTVRAVKTKRMGFGANRDSRVPCEYVVLLRKGEG